MTQTLSEKSGNLVEHMYLLIFDKSIIRVKMSKCQITSIWASVGLVIGFAVSGQNVQAQGSNQIIAQPQPLSITQQNSSLYNKFSPREQTSTVVLDYQIWDAALQSVVLRLGESIRRRARRPNASVGTRFISGHKSAYRLEGSRVTFSYMDNEFKRELSAYRADLVHIANQIELTHLAKNEQLAFWYNLHNALVIENIALNYPTKKPAKLLIGPLQQPFHDAKLVTIKGVPLSLRDIRENIVYRNWDSPKVIYGFFYGNIGGPALQNYAITSENVDTVLSMHASEFINSLRGFHAERKTLKVSVLYQEARPYFFENWTQDLKDHLSKYTTPDVTEELIQDKPIAIDKFDDIVADLLGGSMPITSYVSQSTDDIIAPIGVPPEIARLMNELHDKAIVMRRRGMVNRGGTVIIEDIYTSDGEDKYDENAEGSLATQKPEE
ncbi:MAG: hypothetical protein COB92_03030 [Robiginitomaculum sp.]|nr:MAG: hypothetical protein COB92_03030 [Robiginitomaculum sp.]